MINVEELGIFSIAGKDSEDKYNILRSFNKIKNHRRNSKYSDAYYPDKEYIEILNGKNPTYSGDIVKETNFDIEEIKQEIKSNNIYYKEDKNKNKITKIQESRNKGIMTGNNSNKNNKIELVNKSHLFKGKKYKYYNEHIKRINKYKQYGLYNKILSQQETSYSPNLDFIYKKIFTGPKWDKLTGRSDLIKLDKNKQGINVSTSTENKISKRIKKINEKNYRNKNLFFTKVKTVNSAKNINSNSMLKTQISTGKNFNTTISNSNNIKTNLTTNELLHSSKENTEINNNIIIALDYKKNSLFLENNKTFFDKNNILLIKPNNFTINSNIFQIQNKLQTQKNKNIPIKKQNYLPGPDFNRYLDLEKIERKKKRLQKVPITKIILTPNYSAIDGNIKSFVNYKIKKNTLNKKPKEFIGINSSEFLYDPSRTFEKIYGNKMCSVPKFQKISEKPNEINLPTFMKGVYSRLGIQFNSEKTLKMNNYENGKMYRSQSSFGRKESNKYKIFRKVRYESDKALDVNKIQQDLDTIKKKFNNIKLFNKLKYIGNIFRYKYYFF